MLKTLKGSKIACKYSPTYIMLTAIIAFVHLCVLPVSSLAYIRDYLQYKLCQRRPCLAMRQESIPFDVLHKNRVNPELCHEAGPCFFNLFREINLRQRGVL